MSLKRQMAEDEGFLSRWSRLKRRPEPAIEEIEPQADKSAEQLPATEAQAKAETEPSEAVELPDIETLGPGSDFKPFMNPTVAPEVRNQALKKLWASNPLYNHIDMLDDYCEDYTDKAMVVPGMKTAYKVGRGFLDAIEKASETKLESQIDETDPEIPTEQPSDEDPKTA